MFGKYFTLKTSRQRYQEQTAARDAEESREMATGLDSIISKRRAEVDDLEASIAEFTTDIRNYFNRAGLGGYLTNKYNVTTKFEEPKDGNRQMGMKWVLESFYDEDGTDELKYEFSFSFIEKGGRVRLDFRGKIIPDNDDSHHISTHREGYGDGEYVRSTSDYKDAFESTRKFQSYEAWAESNALIPAWFVLMLKTHIRPL